VAVDYVSKWVKVMPCRAADAKHTKKIFHEIIFLRFEVPRMVISDGGTHFTDKNFHHYLLKHGIHHNVVTPYHPQTSGQAETSNKQIKNILQKTINEMEPHGKINYPMHFGLIIRPTRHHWVCHHISWYMERLVIYLWS
jgi:transposase InsO family protein